MNMLKCAFYLSKFYHNFKLHECAKRFYFHHPEKICNIINSGKDSYFNDIEFRLHYELPHLAFESYDILNAFIQTIISKTDNEHLSDAKYLVGAMMAKALNDRNNGNFNVIYKTVENYHNKEFDKGFVIGHNSLFRTIGDGTDQKEKYSQLMSEAAEVEIDYPHTASLLKIIAKDHLILSKSDYVFSELGDFP
ncbi:MAG: hypothetical protein K5695_14630 [Oscillospiraceae bacterium]|nr:hypothetical protein [Oscillospiraceae bacterium]